MSKLIWTSSLAEHSGHLNLIYLTPEGEVESDRSYSDVYGHFVMGGPALSDEFGDLTKSAHKLVSLLGKGFHFFPRSREDKLRKAAEELLDKYRNNDDKQNFERENDLMLVGKGCSGDLQIEFLKKLVGGEIPEEAVAVLINYDEAGFDDLCMELAQIYYRLPQKQREDMELKRDWSMPERG